MILSKPDKKKQNILKRFGSPRFIGGGGQKTVYQILHPTHGITVAKIGSYKSNQQLERISREVSVLKNLSSPYYPKQFSFEVIGDHYLIIEEFINGSPLDKALQHYTSEDDLLELLHHLVLALAELWSRRIVHRDLKPANIIITNAAPVIIDLGIARLLDYQSLTLTFAPFGPCTPPYASLEQLQNSKRKIDHRSDQFTLGIVAAQLALCGQHPFDPTLVKAGNSIPENIISGRWAKKKLASAISQPTYELIEKMLGHHAYSRFRKYNQLQNAIQSIM